MSDPARHREHRVLDPYSDRELHWRQICGRCTPWWKWRCSSWSVTADGPHPQGLHPPFASLLAYRSHCGTGEVAESPPRALRRISASRKRVVSAYLWEVPSSHAQVRATKGEMLAQRWKGLRLEVKRQSQHYSTYWTTEVEEGCICSARVTGIGGGEEKEESSDATVGHRRRKGA